MTSSYYILLS